MFLLCDVGPHSRHQRRLNISAKLKRQRYPKSLQSPGLQSTTTAMPTPAITIIHPTHTPKSRMALPFYINHPNHHNLPATINPTCSH
ncbi:hypothetical protein M422DRAFT_31383 [Sphaerobolus stellatus SS14]|uniref:Uncharacterized protein n=1 Tax=Sphaerobolus stellatus (strain SS14) TaxID=990650 RepID=A0A0C9VV76_SPHS4|nr:hypothetical protein M422DRAFT_31383 [Sphaerobolus stellatus SS14]